MQISFNSIEEVLSSPLNHSDKIRILYINFNQTPSQIVKLTGRHQSFVQTVCKSCRDKGQVEVKEKITLNDVENREDVQEILQLQITKAEKMRMLYSLEIIPAHVAKLCQTNYAYAYTIYMEVHGTGNVKNLTEQQIECLKQNGLL